MKNLTKFDLSPSGDGCVLQLTGEDGEAVSFTLTAEQLDALIETADELLEEDDSAFEVEDDGQTYQKPLG